MMRLPELYVPRPWCKAHDLPLLRRMIDREISVAKDALMRTQWGIPLEYFQWVCPDERHSQRHLDPEETFTHGVDYTRKRIPDN